MLFVFIDYYMYQMTSMLPHIVTCDKNICKSTKINKIHLIISFSFFNGLENIVPTSNHNQEVT